MQPKKCQPAAIIYKLAFVLMAYSVICITVGQFIPVYFKEPQVRVPYYLTLFIVLVITTPVTIFKLSYDKEQRNMISSILVSLFFAVLTFVFFGIWTIGLLLSCWKELNTYYVQKDNPGVKIITRYKDGGAYDSGPLPGGIKMVVHRPLLYFLKLETAVDTSSLDKLKWIKK